MRRWLVLACAGGFASLVEGCTFGPIDALTSGGSDASVNHDDASVNNDSGVHDAGVHDASQPDAQDSAASQDAPSGDAMAVADGGEDACTPPTPPAYEICTTGFGPAPHEPVIDGFLDCGVPLWPMTQVVAVGSGPLTAVPPEVQAYLGVGWRPDGLYVYVEVTGLGPNRYPAPPWPASSWGPYCGDAIELFVDSTGVFPPDAGYNIPGTIQIIMAAPPQRGLQTSLTYPYQQQQPVAPASGPPRFTIVATDTGYKEEAFFQAADLGPDAGAWSLAPAGEAGVGMTGQVGFAVAIDVGSPDAGVNGCPREVQFLIQLPDMQTPSCDLGCDSKDFCTPTLLSQ